MSLAIQTKLLSEIAYLEDSLHQTPTYAEEGIPMVRVTDIKRGFVNLSGAKRVTKATFKAFTKRYSPKPGDILFSRVGSYGNSCFVNRKQDFCLGQNTVCIAPRREYIDPFYLYCCLNSDSVRHQIEAMVGCASQPTISLRSISTLGIPCPDRISQGRIADILFAYDDLIENNTRRINILEEMAQMLYREWFVNFRFPGHENVKMVESELGPIPQDWTIRRLFDVAEVTYGYPFKSKLFGENRTGVPVIRIRDIRSDFTNTSTSESANAKYVVNNGDLLVGMDGDFHMGKWAGGTAYLNQRVVRFRPKEGISSYILFLWLQAPIYHFDCTIVGTTVAHLSDRDLRSIRFAVPNSQILEKGSSLFDPLFHLEICLKLKNTALRRTRDLLLPKLISGEIPVEAAEDTAAELVEQTA